MVKSIKNGDFRKAPTQHAKLTEPSVFITQITLMTKVNQVVQSTQQRKQQGVVRYFPIVPVPLTCGVTSVPSAYVL